MTSKVNKILTRITKEEVRLETKFASCKVIRLVEFTSIELKIDLGRGRQPCLRDSGGQEMEALTRGTAADESSQNGTVTELNSIFLKSRDLKFRLYF